MPHDFETRTIDYREDSPPDWATPEEKAMFWPKHTAMFICDEIERAEKRLAAEHNTQEIEVAAE